LRIPWVLRRLYEQYRIFDATYPNVPSISSLNALVVGRDHQGVTVFGIFLRGKNATRRTKSEREEVFIEQTR